VKKEYDIIYELGRRNWLDVTAGEALVLGYLTKDVELQMRGTALAEKVLEVRFDSDDFFKIEAQATDLKELIRKSKEKQEMSLFIDDIYKFEGGKKSLGEWEYELVLAEGRYEIRLTMPEYFGKSPYSLVSDMVEEAVRTSYEKPKFEEMIEVEDSKVFGHQKLDITNHYTIVGKLVCHTVDFNHEDVSKRGKTVVYYIDEYQQAVTAWAEVRSISGQKR